MEKTQADIFPLNLRLVLSLVMVALKGYSPPMPIPRRNLHMLNCLYIEIDLLFVEENLFYFHLLIDFWCIKTRSVKLIIAKA